MLPPSGGSNDTQLQRTRADIKNVLPIDLYECMGLSSRIAAATVRGHKHIQPRLTSNFYEAFFMLFQFTAHLVSDPLKQEIRTWFETMPGRHKDTPYILHGTRLYVRFYNELAEYGVVTLFEGVIQPNFSAGITSTDLLKQTEPGRKR
jgi:hypothetical protein